MGNEYLLHTMERMRNQLAMQTVDIPEERMCRQALNGVNHAAWLLGHMLWFEHGVLVSVFGAQIAFNLEANWTQVYGTASEPRNAAGLYKPKSFYLEHLETTAESARRVIRDLPPPDFEKPNAGERSRGMFPTLGAAATALCTHRAYHLGQLAFWRKTMGLPHAGL